MKSRWCQRASLRRRRFRGSNSVPFSDLFWVRIVLAVSATTASLIGPALVHQCRAAWTVRRWLRGATRCDRGTPCSASRAAAAGPSLGFSFDARRRSRPRPLGGTSEKRLGPFGDGPQTALTLKWLNGFALGEGRQPLNNRAHLGAIRPSPFILRSR